MGVKRQIGRVFIPRTKPTNLLADNARLLRTKLYTNMWQRQLNTVRRVL
jgi:hypothetical protein